MENQPYIDEYGGEDYLIHCIKTGITAGIKVNNKLVAWELFLDDGTLGFLRVLPQFRNQGMAISLHHNLAIKLKKQKKRSISYVSIYNKRVVRMAIIAGMKIKGMVSWVRLRSKKEIDLMEKGIF